MIPLETPKMVQKLRKNSWWNFSIESYILGCMESSLNIGEILDFGNLFSS